MKIFGFAGYSGSGKTTLIEKLIPRFTARGLTVSLIKHAHHEFDVDKPGKDSWRHRKAGCAEVLVTSSRRWALMHELRGAAEPDLQQHIGHISPCDLVLIEGFKREPIPKIEIHRETVGEPLLYPHDSSIVAIAGEAPPDAPLPRFDLDDVDAIAAFVLTHTGLARSGQL